MSETINSPLAELGLLDQFHSEIEDEEMVMEPLPVDLEDIEKSDCDEPDSTAEVVPRGVPDDLLDLYFKEMKNYRLLTAEEEIDLGRKKDVGIKAKRELDEASTNGGYFDPEKRQELEQKAEQGDRAVQDLVKANLRLVVWQAGKFNKQFRIGLDELVQEGNGGLIRAAEKFDPERGYKFSTYATWWIRQAMQRGIANSKRTIRLPQLLHDAVAKIGAARERLEGETGRTPTIHELAEATNLDEDTVRRASTAEKTTISYNRPVGNEEGRDELFDFVAVSDNDTEEEAVESIYADTVLELSEQLVDETTWNMVIRYYGVNGGVPETLDQIAEDNGVSRETVRKIIKAGLQTIRETIADSGFDHTT